MTYDQKLVTRILAGNRARLWGFLEDRADPLQHLSELLVPVQLGGLVAAADELASDEDAGNLESGKVKQG